MTSGCEVSFVDLLTTGSAAGTSVQVNQSPVSVATDPNGDRYAAVGAASQAGSIDIIDLLTTAVTCRVSGVQLPSGVVFDPVNQVFVAANSLQNNIVIVDPLICIPTTVRVGINPTSLDYDFQTSTLVTVNSASNTMSFLDYMCPPAVGAPVTCYDSTDACNLWFAKLGDVLRKPAIFSGDRCEVGSGCCGGHEQ